MCANHVPSRAAIAPRITELQNVQRRNPPTSPAWQEASVELHRLYAAVAKMPSAERARIAREVPRMVLPERLDVPARQFLATAAAHERIAKAYRKFGKHADADAAERAAKICRENAEGAR